MSTGNININSNLGAISNLGATSNLGTNVGATTANATISTDNLRQVFDLLEKEGFLKEAQLAQSTSPEFMGSADDINITLNETYARDFFSKKRAEVEVLKQLKRGRRHNFAVLNYLPFRYAVQYNYTDALEYLLKQQKLPTNNNIALQLILKAVVRNYPQALYLLLEHIHKLSIQNFKYIITQVIRDFTPDDISIGNNFIDSNAHSIHPYHNVLKVLYFQLTKIPNLKEVVLKDNHVFDSLFRIAVYFNLVQPVIFFVKNALVPNYVPELAEILTSVYNATNRLQYDINLSTKQELRELMIKKILLSDLSLVLPMLYRGLGGNVINDNETELTGISLTSDNLYVIDTIFQKRPYERFFPEAFGSIDFLMEFIGPNLGKFSSKFLNEFFEDALTEAIDRYSTATRDPIHLVILFSSISDTVIERNFPKILKLLDNYPNILIPLLKDKRIAESIPKFFADIVSKISDEFFNVDFSRSFISPFSGIPEINRIVSQDYLDKNPGLKEMINILFKGYELQYYFDSPVYIAAKLGKLNFAKYLYYKTGQIQHPDNGRIITVLLESGGLVLKLYYTFLNDLLNNADLTNDDLNRFDKLIDKRTVYFGREDEPIILHKAVQAIREKRNGSFCIIM